MCQVYWNYIQTGVTYVQQPESLMSADNKNMKTVFPYLNQNTHADSLGYQEEVEKPLIG